MKFNFTFYALMTALAVLTLFSCKDDDDAATLSGSWKMNMITDENCTDPDEDVVSVANANGEFCDSFFDITVCTSLSFAFTETTYSTEGVVRTTTGGVTETQTETTAGTYTTEGDQITLCETGETTCETGTFSISGNTLTIAYTEGDDCDTIIKGEKQ